MHATCTVTAKSWDETTVAGEPPHSVARALFTTAYDGDLSGESTCALLISYTGGDPADPQSLVGPYVGYEHVTGTLDGKSGTFVLAASGDHTGGVARTDVTIVAGSGTGELAGIAGSGSYAATDMTYTLELDYRFG
jgi:hypothetical protein